MKNPVLDIPADYDKSTATKTQIRMWEKEVDIPVNKKDNLNTNIRKLFSLIMGQCTESLKAMLKVVPTFQAIEDYNDVMGFLCEINGVDFKFEAHENIQVSLWNMKISTVNTYQNHLDRVKYLDKVKSQVSISKQINSGIWYDPVTTEAEMKITKMKKQKRSRQKPPSNRYCPRNGKKKRTWKLHFSWEKINPTSLFAWTW